MKPKSAEEIAYHQHVATCARCAEAMSRPAMCAKGRALLDSIKRSPMS